MNRKLLGYKGIVKRIENDPKKREEAIKNNIPVRFEIKRDQSQLDKLNILDDIWNIDAFGKKAVHDHDKYIQKHAKKHNIDPDIVRSVMFAENARGHKLGFNKRADKNRDSESPLPMNVQKNRWASLIDKKPDDLYDPDYNVEAATLLLRRISDRVEKPDAAKIGSIWNYMGREKTNEFGEYVGQIYEKKTMENSRLKKFFICVSFLYVGIVVCFSLMFIYVGLDVFYQDYDEYCTYVLKTDSYHFLIEGKQPCKIQWNNFLGIPVLYLLQFIVIDFIACLPIIALWFFLRRKRLPCQK